MKVRGAQEDQFVHLVRLGWDLRVLGVSTSLVLPVRAVPRVEITSTSGALIQVQAVRHARGWLFTWRPWWSVLWRRDEWAWAYDPQAPEKIKRAVSA